MTEKLKLTQPLTQETLAAFRQEHKEAFRIAFDMLKERLFPPQWNEEYFRDAYELIKKSVEEHRNNRLLLPLYVGIMDYLNDLAKETRHTEGADENH